MLKLFLNDRVVCLNYGRRATLTMNFSIYVTVLDWASTLLSSLTEEGRIIDKIDRDRPRGRISSREILFFAFFSFPSFTKKSVVTSPVNLPPYYSSKLFVLPMS